MSPQPQHTAYTKTKTTKTPLQETHTPKSVYSYSSDLVPTAAATEDNKKAETEITPPPTRCRGPWCVSLHAHTHTDGGRHTPHGPHSLAGMPITPSLAQPLPTQHYTITTRSNTPVHLRKTRHHGSGQRSKTTLSVKHSTPYLEAPSSSLPPLQLRTLRTFLIPELSK